MKTRQILAGLVAVVLVAGNFAFTGTDNKPAKASAKVVAAKPMSFKVDTEKSVLNWNGKKVTGEHFGAVRVSDGSLVLNGNKIVGGTFAFDMNSITVTDLKDPNYNAKLVGHLKSEDFFSAAKHPVSTFKITKVTPGTAGQYNVTGDLTIKGITNAITFPATVKVNGGTVEATGKATIDRTKYDIRYGSKSFFENIGDKAIFDDFTIDLKLVANRTNA